MNKRQKSIILNFVFVIATTAIFVAVMVNVKDLINKSEAIRAMELLAQEVQMYRDRYRSTPPESYIRRKSNELRIIRLGELHYRAQWIGPESKPDTILAYALKKYQLLVRRGYVVMFLDGSVTWMRSKEFKALLDKQQTQAEIDLLQEQSPMAF